MDRNFHTFWLAALAYNIRFVYVIKTEKNVINPQWADICPSILFYSV
jgi:hypothetical protein